MTSRDVNALFKTIDEMLVDDLIKGIPGGTMPFRLIEAQHQNWNLLREDMALPLAILKHSEIEHNSRWMKRFTKLCGIKIAPHGKTTMCPQLFDRQLADGVWGITLCNVSQLQVARRFGIQRVFLANQLVGQQAIRFVLDELRTDTEFELYCLVDSVEGVKLLVDAASAQPVGRPLCVLVEGGIEGRRAGCRSLDSALQVARAVKSAKPFLSLRGVEGYEGVISKSSIEETELAIGEFLDFLVKIAHDCDAENLFDDDQIIISAGGSAFFDIVANRLTSAKLSKPVEVLIRAGCYLTHDSGVYEALHRRLHERSPEARSLNDELHGALEVWAYVLSRPESTRAILSMGKRDCSFDAGFPQPLFWVRPKLHDQPQPLGNGYSVVEMNDQHTFMELPFDSPLSVGDMIAFGISHPCLTFDKWQVIPIVDDHYDVISMVRTFF